MLATCYHVHQFNGQICDTYITTARENRRHLNNLRERGGMEAFRMPIVEFILFAVPELLTFCPCTYISYIFVLRNFYSLIVVQT
jgi:hypothetical protein